jgi:transcriptional regulator of arginine metabolism
MRDLKERRQRTIAELIRANAVSSQDHLSERLGELGFTVTQATISRDLEQIGAVKVRRDGHLSYALADHGPTNGAVHLGVVLRDWVRSISPAGNLVIIKTPPGSAHLVGVALDQSELGEIVGTICGDDTLFIACRGTAQARALSISLQSGLS